MAAIKGMIMAIVIVVGIDGFFGINPERSHNENVQVIYTDDAVYYCGTAKDVSMYVKNVVIE